MTTVTGTGPADMRLLAAKIHAADKVLKKNLRTQMRQEARPVVQAVQASILSMPSHHDGTLRREVARTVSANISFRKTGVSLDVLSRGTRMPEGKTELPKHVDSARGWHHPVYPRNARFRLAPSRAKKYRTAAIVPLVKVGNWTWVWQAGKPGWFENPVIAQGHSLRNAVEQAMRDTARDLS